MKWLNKLERKIGRFAIKGLMYYIVVLNMTVFLLYFFDQTRPVLDKLYLDPQLIMKGELWRLITFIFIPPNFQVIWILVTLYFYYMIGTNLEHEWGSFKFNVYYLIGMLGTIGAAFVTGGGSTGLYLNLSLFFAFERIYPNYEILLFFLIPVKIKYLAWLNWAFFGFTIIAPVFPLSIKLAAAVSLANYFIFFGKDIFVSLKTGRQSHYNRKNYSYNIPKNFSIHKCTICGMTEKDDPNMDFRYCSKCEGDYEYCIDHLTAHEHRKKS